MTKRGKTIKEPKTYLYAHPDKPGVFVSRQRLWQINKIKEGRCQICGKPRKQHEVYCEKCRKIQNDAQNARNAEKRIA